MNNSTLFTHEIKMPTRIRPIVVIGAGGIVEEAHLPAYQKAAWPVSGIFDVHVERSQKLADQFNIYRVFSSLDELIQSSPQDCIYDIAVPASQLIDILPKLPIGSIVMMQKPMGETLQAAQEIFNICEQRQFTASVNFQMKLIPSITVAKNLIDQGYIGELHDMEIRMNIHHPWGLWDFLFDLPRMEMLYHSIHYMDMIRYFLGMPQYIYAKTFQHPKQMQLASTRSVVVFDYDKPIRAFVNTNHGHDFGLKHQDSFVKWEGTQGAIKVTLGKNINFPMGEADAFEYYFNDDNLHGWRQANISGSWYPDAFMATMADLMLAAERTDAPHVTSVRHALETMRLVEAAYESSNHGGIPIL
ncbi:Gfo/Idh/MocA family oxidoreductase [Sphingobacterium sp. SGG-5]|uniref:Gfo/Idh/MocA family protein n=1 Tax=Sphingobacterium sp. SGG-5 TaxID=2710881 RepID=UPI0013EA7EA0|nr:Gfo/Idh/MocA family oxidoreductase [Sphingobacterium sp. SGG-5]NGM60931.1 Gfo/Idh/MocA family oxidoreductase [Sphingobacterium sp. SGG-5]